MTDWLAQAWSGLLATRPLELLAVGFALGYVILATRENIWCWFCAVVSTALYVVIYFEVQLLSESLLNVYYLLIAGYGWYQWRGRRSGPASNVAHSGGLGVTRWPLLRHLLLIVGTAAAVPLLAFWTIKLGAKLPYIDAATTCFSVSATYLVTRKVLENWLYWIVIDAAGIYVNHIRGLQLTSILFVAYTLLAVYGYLQWQRSYQQNQPSFAS